jgi:hypothetical protein
MTETVEGDRMMEKVIIADGVAIKIGWQRTASIF